MFETIVGFMFRVSEIDLGKFGLTVLGGQQTANGMVHLPLDGDSWTEARLNDLLVHAKGSQRECIVVAADVGDEIGLLIE